jgi:hypothetical protein
MRAPHQSRSDGAQRPFPFKLIVHTPARVARRPVLQLTRRKACVCGRVFVFHHVLTKGGYQWRDLHQVARRGSHGQFSPLITFPALPALASSLVAVCKGSGLSIWIRSAPLLLNKNARKNFGARD